MDKRGIWNARRWDVRRADQLDLIDRRTFTIGGKEMSFDRSLRITILTFAISVTTNLAVFSHAWAQQREGGLHRLVAVIDPAQRGVSTRQLVADTERSESGSQLRASMGDPRQLRLLLTEDVEDHERVEAVRDDPEYRLRNSVVLEFDNELAMYRAIMVLLRDPSITRLSRGALGKFSADPLVSIPPGQNQYPYYQWGLYSTNVVSTGDLVGVWARTKGNAYVAVLDNGIKTAGGVHEDLTGSYRRQFSENYAYLHNGPNGLPNTRSNLDETPFPGYDIAGHGTHVAGIIGASNSNSLGGAGICPSCSLMIGRIGRFTSEPSFEPDFQVSGNAIRSVTRRGAQVINMSFGAINQTFGDLPDVHDALLIADDRDVVVVAASGNQKGSTLNFPANDTGLAIAVGGIQPPGTFWIGGYDSFGRAFGSNWSADTVTQQFVAPATQVLSTVYTGKNWNPDSPYDCGDDEPSPTFYSGYGQCQGTSMAAPHIAGIVALMRSVDPLKDKATIRDILAATSSTTSCTDKAKCQLGVPDATAAVVAALGGSNVLNRTTPLFSFYSSIAQNHFYTVVPQMAMAALYAGDLLPQPSSGPTVRYDQIGSALASYGAFPANACGPGTCSNTPKAIALVYTTHVNPAGGADLVPLYRMSYRCGDELLTSPPNAANPACVTNPAHLSHFYSTDEAAVRVYTGKYVSGVIDTSTPGLGYQLDGIEGYIFPTTVPQPSGTVKLCRKYDAARDDYVLFPGVGTGGTNCSGTSDGYTGGNYSTLVGSTDWIGWVRLASSTIGPTQTNNPPVVSLTAPANGAVFSANDQTTVTVSASDSDGSIARVRVYINDKLLDTDVSSPYQITWSNMAPGAYVIRAMAVDNRGAVKSSTTRAVSVNGGPPPAFPHDGGFESPDLPFGTYQPNPSGSGYTMDPVAPDGQSGITDQHSAFNTSICSGIPCYQDPPNGTQAALIQGEKIISKQLLFPYGTYKVRFKVAQRRQNGSALSFRVFIDGNEINFATPMSINFTSWDSSPFTVSAGYHTVTIKGSNVGGLDNTIFIDQLKIIVP